ncbi:SEC-C domain-containing protein [Shewanella profunda]|uniref:PBPRA1643 family SWIM/SEC-C metal-binding motif protein n=1 Tax=Shewanella profunda TaxID=254793 RepID=UPI00200F5B06|nr:PBPRA1643 family SWIM/SEC-C metal-binding motif protein [Shewanella profunda]MCL1088345.1 SEC-C domain-containing protein [Shewanella profunda]
MSDKFFFKGRKTPKPKHESYGYNTKRTAKPGTEAFPLQLIVADEARKLEVAAIVAEHQLFANIEINAEVAEDIIELEGLLNKPKTTTFEKKPNRNEPCACGSGQKFKKCCGK